MTPDMPHSISPESTPADETAQSASQVDNIKPEPETQDVAMEDAPAPAPAAADKARVNLEELFDEEDSDDEFKSSVPAATSQEDASQPAPMYATPHLTNIILTCPTDGCLATSHLNLHSPIPT